MQPSPDLSSHPSLISPSPPKSNCIDALLVLRAFACLMVVVIHCSPPRNSILFHGVDFSWLTFSHGMVAVWIFFCLSGYLIGKAFYSGRYDWNWEGVLNFWRNRALRILPLYSFNVLLLSIFVYPEVLKLENWGILLRIFTFTYQGYLSSQPLSFNGVIWSLSTEVQFYLLVPFLYAILKRYALKRNHVCLIVALILLAVFSLKLVIWIILRQEITDKMEYGVRYWYTPLATNLDIFLVGFLMNPLLRTWQQSKETHHTSFFRATQSKVLTFRLHKLLAITLIVLLYLFTAHHFYYQELWSITPERIVKGFRTTTTIFILPPLTALVTAYFIFSFEVNAPSTPRPKLSPDSILQNPYRLIEVFGHLSYGVYLWHAPIMQKIFPLFTSAIPIEAFYLRLQATLLLSLILATVTYYVIEMPAARWKFYRYPEPKRCTCGGEIKATSANSET